jgi:hypothetical protein
MRSGPFGEVDHGDPRLLDALLKATGALERWTQKVERRPAPVGARSGDAAAR